MNACNKKYLSLYTVNQTYKGQFNTKNVINPQVLPIILRKLQFFQFSTATRSVKSTMNQLSSDYSKKIFFPANNRSIKSTRNRVLL